MTINDMMEEILVNAKEADFMIRMKRKDPDKAERIKRLVRNYSDVGALLDRRSLPRKPEIERVLKMSRILRRKIEAV